MSYTVRIDYKGVAIRCNSVCEVAEERLKELDEMLIKLKQSASTLMKGQAVELAKAIEKEREDLSQQIESVRAQVAMRAKLRDNSILSELGHAGNLQHAADRISSERIIEFRSLLTTMLGESMSESYRKLREHGNGVITVDSETRNVLDGIADSTLRQFTYIAYLKDNTLAGDMLIAAGKALMDKSLNETYESRLAEEEAKIRAELESTRIDSQTVKKIMGTSGTAKEKLTSMRQAATQEIVGEKVRQKALKVIIEAIKKRGFIVDKKNIKIQRDTNEVVAVALKASGETAKFRIFADGKFIYDFHGYEGQACLKDIDPFMHDLEDVYGIKVVNRTEIWSNPDKISTMKYQAINTNKNKK